MKKEIEENLKILVVDDHDMRVVGIAHSGLEAVQKTSELLPDVIIMDVEMPQNINGIEATKRILKKFPHIKILMFSAYPSPMYVKHSLEAGACGYVVKNGSLKELVRAIKKIMQGRIYLWDNLPATEENIIIGFESFTEREKEILTLIALSKKPSFITKKLNITAKTLRVHTLNMRKKTRAKNDLEMVMSALKYRYLTLDGLNISQ